MGPINDRRLVVTDYFACLVCSATAMFSTVNTENVNLNDFCCAMAAIIPAMYRIDGDFPPDPVVRLSFLAINLLFNGGIPMSSSYDEGTTPLVRSIVQTVTVWNCGRDLYDLYRGHFYFPLNGQIAQEEIEVEVPITSSELFIINLGAALIIDEVLVGASGKTEKKFIAMDPDILNFVISKAIFLSSLKSSRNPVPKCFASETRDQILALRRELRDQNPIKETLIELFESPQAFKMGINDTAVLPFFNRIRAHSISELSNPAFLSCIQRAVNLLQERRMQASLRALPVTA